MNITKSSDKQTSDHHKNARSIVKNLLEQAGIEINGPHPWDLTVHNEAFYQRLLTEGPLGVGEAYMDGWWEAASIDQLIEKVSRAKLENQLALPLSFKIKILFAKLFNLQTKRKAQHVAHTHYNLGNQLFQAMLDKRMVYSCGYWKNATTLDEAQEAKLSLICKKVDLKAGEHVLDIGCGWGGFARYAVENFGVKVTAVTISQQQYDFAKQYCAGLPIEIYLQDYRDIKGQYDKVVSIGMFEHVGHLNYYRFMQIVDQALKPEGLFLLHTIGGNKTSFYANEWITKYIFPYGMIPSMELLSKAIQHFFVMEDWHNFGADYDKTLMAWYENFKQHWEELKPNYNKRFYRMWAYYLLSCAGGFRARDMQLWQIVLSKNGVPGGYHSIR